MEMWLSIQAKYSKTEVSLLTIEMHEERGPEDVLCSLYLCFRHTEAETHPEEWEVEEGGGRRRGREGREGREGGEREGGTFNEEEV